MTEPDRISETYYRSTSSSNKRGPMSDYAQIFTRDLSTDNTKYQRLTSEHNPQKYQRKQFQQQTGRTPQRKQNYVINNLRNELQNIKSEMAKLMGNQSSVKMKIMSGQLTMERSEDVECPPSRPDRFMDNSSTSSFALSRPKMKPRLTTQTIVDKQRYFQLENQILKNQLKNLKNKYVLRKNQYKEQSQTLHKKIFFLQQVIARNEDQMAHYKNQIQNQISSIRQDMIYKRSSPGSQTTASQQDNEKLLILENQNFELKQEISYLRKRTAQSNQQIKKMAIQNNELSNHIRKEKRDFDRDQFENFKLEHSKRIKQKQDEVIRKDKQISQLIKKQNIANEIVRKNTELISLVQKQREYSHTLETKLQLFQRESSKLNNGSDVNSLQQQLDKISIQYESMKRQKTRLESDLSALGQRLMNLKIQNDQLKLQSNSHQNKFRQYQGKPQIQSQDKFLQIQSLRQRNFNLEGEMGQIKGYINEMVMETAQKMNQVEVKNRVLQNQIENLQKQNYNLKNRSLQTTMQGGISATKETRRLQQLQSWKITLQQTIEAKDRQIDSLRYELRRFSELYSIKCKQAEDLQIYYSKSFQAQSDKQSYLNSVISNLNRKMEQQSILHNQTLSQLKQQIKIMSQNGQRSKEQEAVLQNQLLNNSNQEIQRLRESISTYKFALDNLQSKFEMQKLKLISERKGIQSSFEAQIQSIRNELSLSTRTIDSMYMKLKSLSQELYKKDEMILKYMSQNSTDYQQLGIESFVHEYRNVSSIQRVKETLHSQLTQIQRLTNDNITLMKHISRLQQQVQRFRGEQK